MSYWRSEVHEILKNEKLQIREKNSLMLIVSIGSGGKVLLKKLPVDHSGISNFRQDLYTYMIPVQYQNDYLDSYDTLWC